MIQANELRIGNWLSIKKIYGGFAYYQIDSSDIPRIERHPETAWLGIPLTPEILEKTGFKLILSGEILGCYNKEDQDISFAFNDGGYWACWEDAGRESSISTIGKRFRYVHQLQNLYFALTGTELDITL